MVRRHVRRSVSLSIAIAALALFAAAAWLATRQTTLDWIAAAAEERSAGQVRIEGLSGSLFGTLRARRVIYREGGGATGSSTFDDLELAWSPLKLLSGHLAIDRLTVRQLSIVPGREKTSTVIPDSLAAPLPVNVASISLRTLIHDGKTWVSDIGGSLQGDAAGWKVDVTKMKLVVAEGQSIDVSDTHATIAAAAPHALSAQTLLAGQIAGQSATLHATFGGTPAALETDLELTAGAAHGSGHLVLSPLAEPSLNAAEFTLEEIDPHLWHAKAPRARIGAQLALQGAPTGGLSGEFVLHNAAPGPLKQHQLPVQDLRGTLVWRGDRLSIAGLRLDPLPGLVVPNLPGGKGPLTGTIEIARAGTGWQFNGKVGAGRTAPLKAEFALHLENETLRIEHLRLATGKAHLSTSGTVDLGARRLIRLAGELAGFDPSQFGEYPQARLGGSFNVAGQFSPSFDGQAAVTLADSRWRGAALAGKAQAEFKAGKIGAAEVDLLLAGNRVQAHGRLGGADSRLDWEIDAPRLTALLPELSGRLRGKGSLTGRIEDPAIRFSLLATDFIVGTGPRVASARIEGDGHRGQHQVTATIRVAGRDISTRLAGGLTGPIAAPAWQGQLTTLTLSGRPGLVLQAPAKLEISRTRQRLGTATLALTPELGSLRLDIVERDGERLRAAGAAQGLPLLKLLPAHLVAELEGALSLGAQWQFELGRQLSGQARVWREHGDLRPRLEQGPALGLSRLDATLKAADGRIEISAGADSTVLGSARLEGSLGFDHDERGWGVPPQSALSVRANAKLSDLAWLGRLLPRLGLETGGALQMDAQAGGTFSQPRLTGRLSGQALAFRLPEQGVDLAAGTLDARFDGDRLVLNELRLQGTGKEGGLVRATGSFPFTGADPNLMLLLNFDHLRMLSRPDRLLVLDGSSRVALQQDHVGITGKLRIARGLFHLPENDGPVLSEDVTVVGRAVATEKTPSRFTSMVDLRLDFGDDFQLRGRGLEAKLAGELRLRAAGGAPLSAHGSLRFVDGRYVAYGQSLDIERGVVNFVGPLGNPGLDAMALRKNLPVEAGVVLGGTALAPQAKLISNPWVPDAEKLSWLVLGHGLEAGGKGDLQLLAVAARALLGSNQGSALEKRVANAFGLDELSIGMPGAPGGGLEGTVLTLGKRLSSKARVSIEQALAGTGTAARLHYQLTKRLSIRTQAGSENAADLFYTWSFD